MRIKTVRTNLIKSGDSLLEILGKELPNILENTVIAISSKIVSICQQRVIPCDSIIDKNELIKQEADAFLIDKDKSGKICLTLKNNMLIPFAGIDESNGNGNYILYPENIEQITSEIWQYLRNKHQINNLGIILTDSNITPLRRGVTGVAVGWCGFKPLYDYYGKSDLYGRKLSITQINILDALATAAVLNMGEGEERTPIAIITEIPKIKFLPITDFDKQKISIASSEDFYGPVLCSDNWVWKDKK